MNAPVKIETKHIEIATKFAVDDAGLVEGIAWPFSPDRGGDEIMRGAFKVDRLPLPLLFGHSSSEPAIGVWESATETEQGLVVKGRLLLEESQKAKTVRANLAAGLGALSIGFVPEEFEFNKSGGITWRRVTLVEVSIVNVGQHSGARVTQFKSQGGPMPNTESAGVESAIEKAVAPISAQLKSLDGLPSRLDEIEAKLNRAALRSEAGEEISEERKSFIKYLRHGDKQMAESEVKTLRVAENPAGGYLADGEFSAEWIRELAEYSPFRAISSVKTTSYSSVRWPKRNGRTNAKWRGELQTSEKSGPTFGEMEIFPKELATHVEISNRLLMDAVVDVEAEVRLAFAEDFGIKEGFSHLFGDGVLEPKGLLADGELDYFANGHGTNLSADALIAMMYSLPAYYRSRGTWAMSGSTLAKVRQLKDGTTQAYLWQPSFQAGQPETLLGRPVVEHPDMPEATSGKFPIIFGSFREYQIVDRQELGILVDPFTAAKDGMTILHGARFTGAGVRQKAAFKKLKMSTT